MNDQDDLEERDGTAEDVDVTRYYYDTPDKVRQHVDWDGRLLISEAAAVKKVAELTVRQFVDGVAARDPQALQALVWVLRKHRGGERELRLGQVDFDLSSVRVVNLDAEGRRVIVPPPPDPDQATVDAVAADLRKHLPGLTAETAESVARVAIGAVDPEGEADAGDEPAASGSTPTTSS